MITFLRSRAWLYLVLLVLCAWGFNLTLAKKAHPASGDEGSAAGIVLRMDPGAQSSAFGSAYAARSNNPMSIHFNPAGLGTQTHTEGMFTHFQLFAGIEYNHLSLVTPISSNRAGLGFSLTSLDYGDLQRSEVANQNPQMSGMGQFGADDITSSASLGLSLTDSLKAGLTASYFRQQIAGYKASTMTGDVGLQYHIVPGNFVLGAAARNVGGEVTFIEEGDPLPMVYDGGIFYSQAVRGGADVLNLGGDMVFPSDADAYLSAGVEYGFYRTLYLRLGYNGSQEADDGFSIGGGIHDQRFKINYSYVPFGELGNHQRLTLTYFFGDLEEESGPSVRQPAEPIGAQPEPRKKAEPQKKRDGLMELLRRKANQPGLKPPSGEPWLATFKAGKKAYRNGNYRKARRLFMRTYRSNPGHVKNLLWLGTMEWYLGMDKQAIQRMKQVLLVDPDNRVARKNLKRMKAAHRKQ